MKRGLLVWVIAANLVVLIALVFIFPHLMVSPGALAQGHADLATDCFACHAPWRGVASQRCVSCHKLADIGLRTTTGASLAQAGVKTAFHQELMTHDCVACHSDHAGLKLTQRSRKPFSHALLRASAQQQCAACHKAPADALHRRIEGSCAQCHTQSHWKPATFDHAKRFVLDRDHDTTCVTCHANNDYSRYTCYGCHEHTPAKVRAEHEEEGIRDFENCVECHRDPRVEPQKRGRTGDASKRERD